MTRRRIRKLPGEGLHLRLINGETVRLRRFEAARVMTHRYLLCLYLLLWAGLVLIDPSGQAVTAPLSIRVPQYGVGAVAVVAALLLTYGLAEALFGGRGRIVSLLNWPVVLAGSVIGLAASETAVYLLTDTPRMTAKIFATLAVFYFVIIEVIVQLVIWLLLPRMLAELRQDGPAPPAVEAEPDTPAPLRAGGHDIAPDAVLHVAAQGNYVTVQTDTARVEVPGPFAALLDQMPPGLGLRIHRSHWVARRAVTGHRRRGREMVLDLIHGAEAPVALPRQAEVLDWLAPADPSAAADPPRPANGATPPPAPVPARQGGRPPPR